MTTNTREAYAKMDAYELVTLFQLTDSDEDVLQYIPDDGHHILNEKCKKFVVDFYDKHKRDPSIQEWMLARAQMIIVFLNTGSIENASV